MESFSVTSLKLFRKRRTFSGFLLVISRPFTTGFFYKKPDQTTQIYHESTYIKGYTYLGMIRGKNEQGLYCIEQRNKFSVGEIIEGMKPNGENCQVQVKRIVDQYGCEQDSAPHSKQTLYVDLAANLEEYDILRRRET